MAEGLLINEIFFSIQGESSRAGCPCVFVRLRGCHLRCTYCDTEYAFNEGERRSIDSIVDEVTSHPTSLVEITGGEPLLQAPVHELITRLCDLDLTVLIETSGACDIAPCDPRSIRILDLKTPASGEVDRNDWSNIERLTDRDEVKFVVVDRADYEWARGVIEQHDLTRRCHAVLMSPVFEQAVGEEITGAAALSPQDLAEWVLADGLDVRMQLQLHKFIWEPTRRGV
jgi:7-carboxy-7-deazaguanine synthase